VFWWERLGKETNLCDWCCARQYFPNLGHQWGTNANSNADCDGYCHGYRYRHGNRHRDGNRHGHTNGDRHGYWNGNPNPDANATLRPQLGGRGQFAK
jgi:hypothetical protein